MRGKVLATKDAKDQTADFYQILKLLIFLLLRSIQNTATQSGNHRYH
jgi:hypothetical protein